MAFHIIRNDITKVTADAIVNPANPKPVYRSGTDTAIYKAAGAEDLLRARAKIGEIAPGKSAATPAFALHAKYIFHTVGPVWEGGTHGEFEALARCYKSCLALAVELTCRSIAFPLLAAGNNGFPKDRALAIAMQEITAFLLSHEMEIFLVVFDQSTFVLSGKIYDDIDSFVDEALVEERLRSEYKEGRRNRAELRSSSVQGQSLDEIVSHKGRTFQQILLSLIDESGRSDPDVYKSANISRKVFSTIRSHVDYHPSRETALSFAIALHLDLPKTQALLQSAGYTLSESSPADLIIRYCIEHQIYDIFAINNELFSRGLPTLG